VQRKLEGQSNGFVTALVHRVIHRISGQASPGILLPGVLFPNSAPVLEEDAAAGALGRMGATSWRVVLIEPANL
jgi:hypothetical protein